MTIVTLEVISTTVFSVPSGTFCASQPRGHVVGAEPHARCSVAKNAPNSMISEARKQPDADLAVGEPGVFAAAR